MWIVKNPASVCVQKPLVSHPYKNLMTFGGCKHDFMLVLGQSVGTNTSKDRPTEKHLFAMDNSKVSEGHESLLSRWSVSHNHNSLERV